jgi:hypothetical protein
LIKVVSAFQQIDLSLQLLTEDLHPARIIYYPNEDEPRILAANKRMITVRIKGNPNSRVNTTVARKVMKRVKHQREVVQRTGSTDDNQGGMALF